MPLRASHHRNFMPRAACALLVAVLLIGWAGPWAGLAIAESAGAGTPPIQAATVEPREQDTPAVTAPSATKAPATDAKPTASPTPPPTHAPTQVPTDPPTQAPTQAPTGGPTGSPTAPPTEAPTEQPTPPPDEEVYDPVSVSSSADPDSMVNPGIAVVRITLVNNGDSAVDDVEILDAEGNRVYGPIQLPLSDSENRRVFKSEVSVSGDHLEDGGVRYTVRYKLAKGTEQERTVTKKIKVKITKKKASPKLEFSRELSSRQVLPGQQVTLTYRVHNSGNVPLQDIVVKDPLGSTQFTLNSLAPGKRKTFTRKLNISQKSTSKPSASYTYEGASKRKTVRAKSATISIATERLDLLLEADKTTVDPGGEVTLRLTLTNNGSVSYSRLRIYDQVLGELGSIPNELKAGAEYTFSKVLTVKSTTTFQFNVTGRCSTNNSVEYASNELTVMVSPVVENIRLRLEASADHTRLTGEGPVTFTIKMINEGELDIRNVVLSEQSRGIIKTMAVLAPGETSLNQVYSVGAKDTYVFTASLTDPNGNPLTVNSNPITVEMVAPDAAPEPEPEPEATTIPTPQPTAVATVSQSTGNELPENPMSLRMLVILIASALIVLISIYLIVLGVKNRRARKLAAHRKRVQAQRRARAQRQAALRAPGDRAASGAALRHRPAGTPAPTHSPDAPRRRREEPAARHPAEPPARRPAIRPGEPSGRRPRTEDPNAPYRRPPKRS